MKWMPNYKSKVALFLLVSGMAGAAVAEEPAQVAATPSAAKLAVFAKVGESVITYDEFNAAFSGAARSKFYHGKPPDGEIAALQREVAGQLVARILLLREAERKQLRPDDAEIEKSVQTYEKKYAGSDQWNKIRAQALPPLIVRLQQDSLLSQIEKTVRSGVKLTEAEVKAYYAAHQEQFTEPEQLRVSVILLKVDPSAPDDAWMKASEDVTAIAKRARAGEDFAALARQYSGDPSAKQGGDMDYLHGGMLPEGTQQTLSTLKVDEISEPVRLLDGAAIFRLNGRKPARLLAFEAVKARAEGLALREQSDRAWNGFVADLKTKTPAQIDQSRFLPLVEKAKAPAAPK